MQTSRFQLGLIATLAMGLGFSLASSEAVGYPAGAAVSLGTNPVWSVGGTLVSDVDNEVLVVDGSQVAIVSDVVLTTAGNCADGMDIVLETTTGGIVGSFTIASDSHGGFNNYTVWTPSKVSHTFGSGIPVQGTDTLTINRTGGGSCDAKYTLSGYYAQP